MASTPATFAALGKEPHLDPTLPPWNALICPSLPLGVLHSIELVTIDHEEVYWTTGFWTARDALALRSVCKAFRGRDTARSYLLNVVKQGFRQTLYADVTSPRTLLMAVDELFAERVLLHLFELNEMVVAGSFALHRFLQSKGMPPLWHPNDIDVFTAVNAGAAQAVIASALCKLNHVVKTELTTQKNKHYSNLAPVDHPSDDELLTYTASEFCLAAQTARGRMVTAEEQESILEMRSANWIPNRRYGRTPRFPGRLGVARPYRILEVSAVTQQRKRAVRNGYTASGGDPRVHMWVGVILGGVVLPPFNVIVTDTDMDTTTCVANFDLVNVQVALRVAPPGGPPHYVFDMTDDVRSANLAMELVPTPVFFPVVPSARDDVSDTDEDESPLEAAASSIVARLDRYRARGFVLREF